MSTNWHRCFALSYYQVTAEIELLQAGANREQAVGYLDDGTMVVVEDAKSQIGQKIKVEIVRSLQTEAGRMMFAKKVANNHNSANHSQNNSNGQGSNGGRKSKTSKVRERLTNGGKIKTANAFHSDQLKKATDKKPAKKQSVETATVNSRPARRSAESAEADMVRLANR